MPPHLQLMALLGWVPATGAAEPAGHLADTEQPRFVHNSSGRFESRWAMVRPEAGEGRQLDQLQLQPPNRPLWLARKAGLSHAIPCLAKPCLP